MSRRYNDREKKSIRVDLVIRVLIVCSNLIMVVMGKKNTERTNKGR